MDQIIRAIEDGDIRVVEKDGVTEFIFSDEPICPCCNEFMEKRSAWHPEDVAHCPPEGNYVCKSCSESAEGPEEV